MPSKPPLRERISDNKGLITRVWHRYFNNLETITNTVETEVKRAITDIYNVSEATILKKKIDLLRTKISLLEVQTKETIDVRKELNILKSKVELSSVINENLKGEITLLKKEILLTKNSLSFDGLNNRLSNIEKKNAMAEIKETLPSPLRLPFSGSSYSEIEQDGTLSLHGNATCYNDIYLGLSGAKVPSANAPSFATFRGNIKEYTFDVNDYLHLSASELYHGFKEKTALESHIHFATNGVDIDDRTVKWEIEGSIANSGDVFPASILVSAEYTIPANTPDRTHIVLKISEGATGLNFNMGAVITFRVRRIASSGTEPTNDPFGLMVGVHIEMDTIGSRQRYTK